MLARALAATALSAACSVALAQNCIVWTVPPVAQTPNGPITGFVLHNNKLVATGQFDSVNGAPAQGFAQFDGTTWTSLGTVTPGGGGNHSMASWGGRLYATGSLGPAPLAGRGAYWDGASWSVWAPPPSQTVSVQNPLAVFPLSDGTLLVEGNFAWWNPDGTIRIKRRLVTWNGSEFAPLSNTQYGPRRDLDNGISGATVFNALRFQGKTLIRSIAAYSTGPNWNSNNNPCPNGLLTFDGSSFAPFPAPELNGSITDMLLYNGELYICGTFTATTDGSVTLNHFARYNPTTSQWTKCGNGLSRELDFMVVGNDGTGEKIHLFKHGTVLITAYNNPNSTTVDTFNFRGVARYDGSRFSSYGAATSSGFTTGGAYHAMSYDPGTGPALYVSGYGFNPGLLGETNLARRGPAPSPDTDGDGLLDSWEQDGIDVNCDGVVDLDLPAMGAHWRHKDIFVEIDSMIGRNPAPGALQAVVAAFAAAPQSRINNPDGAPGVALHLIVDPADQTIPLADFPQDFINFHDLKTERFGNPADRASSNRANILSAKQLAFRYCLFANRFDARGSSGVAELPGNDFMVTLGTFDVPGGTVDQQAGTFMHELGHTLGLYHGGHQDGRQYNFKPNYHSVMNYAWQFPQGRPGWTLDYSRETLHELDENALDEFFGISGTAGAFAIIGPLPALTVEELGAVDWNRNGLIDESVVSADINLVRDGLPESLDVLEGSEDWSRLLYNFRSSDNWTNGVSYRTTLNEDDMTQQLAHELAAIHSPPRACPADLGAAGGVPGHDGLLDNNDFVVFIDFFFAHNATADMGSTGGAPGADGQWNNNDFVVFIDRFFTGCN